MEEKECEIEILKKQKVEVEQQNIEIKKGLTEENYNFRIESEGKMAVLNSQIEQKEIILAQLREMATITQEEVEIDKQFVEYFYDTAYRKRKDPPHLPPSGDRPHPHDRQRVEGHYQPLARRRYAERRRLGGLFRI